MAQTVDEIVSKHIIAMSGKEKMMSLKTVIITGSFINAQGTPVSLVFTKKHLVGYRTDRIVDGKKGWSIVTPKNGWVLQPGQSDPKEMPKANYDVHLMEFDLQGPFINYKEKGTTIIKDGKDKVADTDCYKLKLTFKNGNHANYYIDTKTYRKVRRTFEEIGDLIYSNYKQNANGYWFAYTEKGNNGGIRNFSKIETNVAVNDKMFEADEGVF